MISLSAPFLVTPKPWQNILKANFALQQLNLTLRTELGPFGGVVQGSEALKDCRCSGTAIIKEEYWDQIIYDEQSPLSVLVKDRKSNESVLYIDDICITNTSMAKDIPANSYLLYFIFAETSVYVPERNLPQAPLKTRIELIIDEI